METPEGGGLHGPPFRLGNFLSGMETLASLEMLVEHLPLETSLVEWKLLLTPNDSGFLDSLETSLVEWKL